MPVQEVTVPAQPPERIAQVGGEARAQSFGELAARMREIFAGRTIWNISSTALGGGVAEMLRGLVGYACGAGVETRWLVIPGDPDFFAITKRVHNGLHRSAGDEGPLGRAEREHYEQVLARSGEELRDRVRPGDTVILHDPQTVGLAAGGGLPASLIWRCHIGSDIPNEWTERAWEWLRPDVEAAPVSVFTRHAYAPGWLDGARVSVIPPSIDPFSPKNAELEDPVAVLSAAGVLAGSPGDRRSAQATVVREGGPLDPDVPVVAQVSRWDRLKDMVGVLHAFAAHVDVDPAHLLLVGPDVAGVSDDPEGQDVLAECTEAWHDLPLRRRRRISLVSLPMADIAENARMVNAVQRHACVVTQKSLMEGFGLTVAEAMWKRRPVVASRVGGISDQVSDGEQGLLVDPEDLAGFGAALTRLLGNLAEADRLGSAARARVLERFLPDRQLEQWARLVGAQDAKRQ